MQDTSDSLPPAAERDFRVFRKSVPLQIKLREVAQALGETDGLVCLDVGAQNSMLSYRLRKRGGDWHTALADRSLVESCEAVLGENVHLLDGDSFPFEDKTFNVIVVTDFLEGVVSADTFIEECHRTLMPDGRLIVNVRRPKPFSVIGPLRKMLGVGYETAENARPGYSESELFGILKHGFNVHHMRSYSRFFVEFTDIMIRFLARRIEKKDGGNERKLKRLYAIAGPLYELARQLDILLFFTRGHNLIATAVRRTWRPRNAPVLTDGRTITEAVLSKAAR